MADADKKKSRRPNVEAVPDQGAEAVEPAGHAAPTCTVAFCPLCLAVTAVQPLRPEVIGHLINAGQELLLALKAVIDGRTDEGDRVDDAGRLEKIDIG